MARRKRQSNSVEYCPYCAKRLTNRASAISHYRSHVPEDLIGDKKLHDNPTSFHFIYSEFGWNRGISESSVRTFGFDNAWRKWHRQKSNALPIVNYDLRALIHASTMYERLYK